METFILYKEVVPIIHRPDTVTCRCDACAQFSKIKAAGAGINQDSAIEKGNKILLSKPVRLVPRLPSALPHHFDY
jgi:hypothetical protein